MKLRPTQEEIQEALEVLALASELHVYGLADFPFWEPVPGDVVGVAGMTRSGKSALMKAFCRWLMKRKRRLIVIDIDDEYSPEGVDRGEECQLGPLRQRLTVPEFLALMERDPDFINRPDLALALVPVDPDEDPEAVAAQILQLAPYLRDADPLVILFEELGYWAEYAVRLLHAVAARWGKRGHVPFFIGQCLTDCPEKARKQWRMILTAQQVKTSDLDFLKRQAGAAARQAVARLPLKRFVAVDLRIPRPEDMQELSQ